MSEARRERLDEQRGLIRAVAGNILAATDRGTAIRVLEEELEELKQTTGEPASEAFMRAVCNTGSICIDCEFCNRTHFVSYGDFDRGELDDLRSRALQSPDKYIEHGDCDYISWGYLEGKQIVWGCPCNRARLYERWIWNHRYTIASYLKSRADELSMEAKFAQDLARDANSIYSVQEAAR